MRILDRRLQLLLDGGRYQKLAFHARRRGVSVAAVIRELIDRLPTEEEQRGREAALQAILEAEPVQVLADPEAFRRELDEIRYREP